MENLNMNLFAKTSKKLEEPILGWLKKGLTSYSRQQTHEICNNRQYGWKCCFYANRCTYGWKFYSKLLGELSHLCLSWIANLAWLISLEIIMTFKTLFLESL